MRKTIVILLAIMILISVIPCTAFAQGYEDMSDQELIEEYNSIRLLLTTRGYAAEDKRVLFDDRDIQIYLNGEYSVEEEWEDWYELYIPIVIVNNRNENIGVQMRNASVNGWGCDVTFSPEVPAQKKLKANLAFDLVGTDLEKLEDFEDVEFSFYIFDDSWDTICESKMIHIFAN